MMIDSIKQIAKELASDKFEHCTADPIFCVMEKKRLYGMDREYTDNWAMVDEEGNDYEPGSEDIPSDAEKVYYCETREVVQPFLTQSGADEYIRANKHRHEGEVFVFVNSAYRNTEWQLIRELLLAVSKGEIELTSKGDG